MWIHESPERLLVQESHAWTWCAGEALLAVGVVLLAAGGGIFTGLHWEDFPSKKALALAGAMALLAGGLPLLRPRGWILEMDRRERTVNLRKGGPWPSGKKTWTFQQVTGARVVERDGNSGSWELELLVRSAENAFVAHRFLSDKASCERARSSIERILQEPPWEEPPVSLRARMRM